MIDKVTILPLDSSYLESIKEFCEESKKAGYQNNSSIELMKFNNRYDLGEIPKFWGAFYRNKIVSVSGCHRWTDEHEEKTLMRCLFRSATLPEYHDLISGLSKNHMNSLPFSLILPFQINVGIKQGVKHFYITTSSDGHDASGKMKRTHRAMQLLEKNEIVKYLGDEIIYSTVQSKWEINLKRYLEVLRSFYYSKKDSHLNFNDEYRLIIEKGFDRFINSSEIKR